MAPKTRGASSGGADLKRKRTVRRPAREPSPDSSSSSTPSNSPAPATSSQVDHLADRVITTGRKVDFELFENEGFFVGRQLIVMGFEKICSLDCPTYPSLVKEFYKNLSRGDNGLVSIVRGIGLNVTAAILSRLLDLPMSGPSTFTPEDRSPALSRLLNREIEDFEEVQANQLTLELRLLHNICSRILFPKTGRFDYVSERDIFVMDAIVSGKPINLPNMIIWYIADCGSKKKSSLPYGMILSKIFLSQGIAISDSEPLRNLRHTDFYSLATIHRMGFVKRNGVWERKSQIEDRVAEAEAPGPSVAGPSVPDPTVAGPSFAGPSEAGPSTHSPPLQSTLASGSFTDEQMGQLRALLTEFDNQRSKETSQLKEDFNLLKEELNSRLDMISFSISNSTQSFSAELHKIFERMEGIADGSGSYINATSQLKKDIDLAVSQIVACVENFKKEQKDEIMEMIGHLKKIVFKLG